MTLLILPILVLLAGLGLWGFAANPKAQEIGRIMFFVGLFWTVAANPAPGLLWRLK